MPKKHKTRLEKQLADQRRQIETLEPKTLEWKPTLNITNPTISLASPVSHVSTSSVYLKKDLTKTLILSILAISLELILYFWLK